MNFITLAPGTLCLVNGSTQLNLMKHCAEPYDRIDGQFLRKPSQV